MNTERDMGSEYEKCRRESFERDIPYYSLIRGLHLSISVFVGQMKAAFECINDSGKKLDSAWSLSLGLACTAKWQVP